MDHILVILFLFEARSLSENIKEQQKITYVGGLPVNIHQMIEHEEF